MWGVFMKYRFRITYTKKPSRKLAGVKIKLAGRQTLRAPTRLPEPIETVRISEEDLKAQKRQRKALGIGAFLKRTAIGLSNTARSLWTHIKKAATAIILWIKKRMTARKEKTIGSLPVLFGAAVSSILVCTLTATYVLALLFLPYAKHYKAVTIPSLQGKPLEEVVLDGDSFNLLVQYENNPDVPDGRIISQSPAPGVTRRIYEKNGFCDILLTVSRHTLPTVPKGLVGSKLRDAALSILNNSLSYTVEEEYSDKEKGTIIRTSPTEGTELSEGGSVRLTVSAGQREVFIDVPSLIGLTESEALLRLSSSRLTTGEITYVRSDKPMGSVISQSPSAHSQIKEGEAVSFTVSAGESFNTQFVPDLYGLSIAEAEKRLYSVGLTVSAVYSVATAAPKGTVIYQSPLPNTAITSSIISVEIHISN